jgi:hypothetical protein
MRLDYPFTSESVFTLYSEEPNASLKKRLEDHSIVFTLSGNQRTFGRGSLPVEEIPDDE